MNSLIDELYVLNHLANDLKNELAESSKKVSRLSDCCQRNPLDVTEVQKSYPKRERSKEDEEKEVINVLEKYRISLVLDLQYHDMIGDQLKKLTGENESFLNSIKFFLQRKEQLRKDEYMQFEKKFKLFTESIDHTTSAIDASILDIDLKCRAIRELLIEFQDAIENDIALLKSEDTRESVKKIVEFINDEDAG